MKEKWNIQKQVMFLESKFIISIISTEYTSADKGSISIDINGLGENRDLVFGLQASNAQGFKVHLTSQQKLFRDKEVPEVQKPDKPS